MVMIHLFVSVLRTSYYIPKRIVGGGGGGVVGLTGHRRMFAIKESNKSRFDSYGVRNSVLIISHITFSVL